MKTFKILKDPKKNSILMKEGFVRLNILNQSEITQLKQYFTEQHTDQKMTSLFVSANQFSKEKADTISQFIAGLLRDRVNRIINEADMLGGTFIVKGAGTSDRLQPHQDWSIVDESNGRSYTIWIALEDTTDENGALYMLPRSHNKFRGYRHLTIPSIYGKVYNEVWNYMIPVHLKAGEGVIFDHAIGHGSTPNRTCFDRVAVTCSILSESADYRFYCLEGNKIVEYKGKADYYQSVEAKFGPGNLEKISVTNQKPYQLSKFQLFYHYGSYRHILSLPWFNNPTN
jgi:hypothetical protein